MTTYTVTEKATGKVIYAYQSETPVEWSGMEFSTHNHTLEPEAPGTVTDVIPKAYIWTKLEYLRRFTQAERIAIRGAAKASPELEDYMELLSDATEVRSDDPDIINALTMLEAVGLIAAGRAQEILA